MSKVGGVALASTAPPEILSAIFELILFDAQQDSYPPREWKSLCDSDLLSPSLFPYSISRVCKAWDNVAASHSEFWTRIVIRLDLPKPVEALKQYLIRSKGQTLHSIHVVQPNNADALLGRDEAEILSQLMPLVATRYTKCENLRIVATHSSSIMKLLPICFQSKIGKLTSIKLESHRRSDHHPLLTFPLTDESVKANHLRILSLIGPHFVMLVRDRHWREALGKGDYFHDLTISHLRAEDGGSEPFFVADFCSSLSKLRTFASLNLLNIDLPDLEHDRESSGADYWSHDQGVSIDRMSFVQVTSSVIAPLLLRIKQAHGNAPAGSQTSQWKNFENLTFDDCSFFNFRDTPSSSMIKVSNISNSDTLSLFFAGADPQRLLLVNCLGLNHASLSSLTVPTRQDGYSGMGPDYPMPSLTAISIHDCPNFAILGLRKVIRHQASGENNGQQISRVRLSGSTPAPSVDEVHWFRMRWVKVTHSKSFDEDEIWDDEEGEEIGVDEGGGSQSDDVGSG